MSETIIPKPIKSTDSKLRNVALALALFSIIFVFAGLFSAILGLSYATSPVEPTRFQRMIGDWHQPLVYFNIYAGTLLVIASIAMSLINISLKKRSLAVASISISGFVFITAVACWVVGLLGLPKA